MVSESLKVPARVWRDYYEGVLTIDDTARLGEIGAPTLIVSDPSTTRKDEPS